MRKYLILLLLLPLLVSLAQAQITGAVTDKATGKPVAYANIWVENENVGVTSEEDGTFSFADAKAVGKMLVVSSLGYERTRFPITATPMSIQLQPSAIALQEVVIKKSKNQKKSVVNDLKKSNLTHAFGTTGGPWIVADFIRFQPAFEATPYLDEIAFIASSKISNAKYQIRIYEATKNGEPGKDLVSVPLIGFAPKGRDVLIELDVSQYNLQVPENGFFVGFEWLIIDENKHTSTFVQKDGSKNTEWISYQPTINSSRPKEQVDVTWFYREGQWSNKGPNRKGVKGTMFQVTLSN